MHNVWTTCQCIKRAPHTRVPHYLKGIGLRSYSVGQGVLSMVAEAVGPVCIPAQRHGTLLPLQKPASNLPPEEMVERRSQMVGVCRPVVEILWAGRLPPSVALAQSMRAGSSF